MARVLFGVVLFLCLLEVGMRTIGRGLLAEQDRANAIDAADAEMIRILAIGESTTADQIQLPRRSSWPSQLEVILRRSGVNARVYNMGRPATNTSAILERLPEQLDRFDPHIVVSMMGTNDRSTLVANRPAWWGEFRVVKLARKLLDRRKDALVFPPVNYGDPGTTESIVKKLQSPDTAEAMSLIESVAKNLNETEKAQYYYFLGTALYEAAGKPMTERVLDLGRRSLDSRFQSGRLLVEVADLLFAAGNERECMEYAKKFVAQNWHASDTVLYHFSQCASLASEASKEEWRDILIEMKGGDAVAVSPTPESFTAENYKAVYRLLKSRKIAFVAMQYPTRPIEIIKDYLGETESEDLVFVENKENFEKALSKHRYEDLFTDNFATTFGHATRLGNELIAENAAAKIADMVGRKP